MQHQALSRPISLFCVAAPIDAALLAQWETYLLPLQQNGFLTLQSERFLQAGEERLKQLTAHLDQADVIVLLLSADFFANAECLTLMDHALRHLREETRQVIPLLVRPVLWRESPLRTLPCLPANETPVTTWEHQDEGWHACVLGLQRLVGHSLLHAQGSSTDKCDHSDRGRLLRWLSRDYQRDLHDSLEHLTWISLGLAEAPDTVRNATHLLQHRPDRSEHLLPADTSILNAYDQAEEALLILGDPGAGKSTLLRDLALQLITRAQQDETHPLPVILPLSSWAVSKPALSDWLVEQLTRIYDVPRTLGQRWVNQGQILPLLDGLDEMEEAARPLCIAAINGYRTMHFLPLVVCSRRTEYQAASTHHRLLLQNAIVVQSLTQEHIEGVIQQGGEAFVALREALQDSQELRELAQTPLMLSVLVIAYHDANRATLPQPGEILERRVWTDYVERMVREKGAELQGKRDIPVKRYAWEQTHSWLTWLAQQMRGHNQTIFYGESLLGDWLPASQQQVMIRLAVSLPGMLLGGCTSLLLSLFLSSGLELTMLTVWQAGLIGGFLGWCLRAAPRRNVSEGMQPSRWRCVLRVQVHYVLRAGVLALLVAPSFGLMTFEYALSDSIRDGIIGGSCLLGSAWLLQVILLHPAFLPPPPSVQPIARWRRLVGWHRTISIRRALGTATILGIGIGMSSGLISGLSPDTLDWPSNGLVSSVPIYGLGYGLHTGLGYGLSSGLIYGATLYLANLLLNGHAETIQLAERVSWTWRPLLRVRHLRMSLIVALAFLCFFELTNGLGNWLTNGLTNGVGYGLSDGLSSWFSSEPFNMLLDDLKGWWNSSLETALSIGLSYWFLVGMYQGMNQNQLENQDRRHFNQGLHRSLRNGLFLSVLGAGIIIGMGVLSNGLSNGMIYGLSFNWFFLFGGWFILWTAMGGLTILRHYILRLLLARSHTFPLHAQRFLDDTTARVLLRRVGGGYGFVHRRLLDYFADTALVPADTSDAAHQAPPVPPSVSDSVSGAAPSESLQD